MCYNWLYLWNGAALWRLSTMTSRRPDLPNHPVAYCESPRLITKPFGITSFADPHPLNPVESNVYQKRGRGEGASHTKLGPQLCRHGTSLSLLESTLTRHLASVDSKHLTASLNPVNATLTKNRGGGYAPRPSSFIISSGQAPAREAASAL